MSVVATFSGRIASGKSTLSRAVAARLGWPRMSFGDHVRSIASRQGLDATSVRLLQDLGEDLVRNHLPEFVARALQEVEWEPGSPLVIDGLRHPEVAQHLQSVVVPSRLIAVHIATDDRLRDERWRRRSGGEARPDLSISLGDLDRHSTEAAAAVELARAADLIVDGSRSENDLVDDVANWLLRIQATATTDPPPRSVGSVEQPST